MSTATSHTRAVVMIRALAVERERTAAEVEGTKCDEKSDAEFYAWRAAECRADAAALRAAAEELSTD